MAEERCEVHVLLAVEAPPLVCTRERGPGSGVRWKRGRPEREHVEDHRLIVALIPSRPKAALRPPRHGHERIVQLEAWPLRATVQRVRDGANLRLHARRAVE